MQPNPNMLLEEISGGNMEFFQKALNAENRGLLTSAMGSHRQTPLMAAAACGQVEMVRQLLDPARDLGIDLNRRDLTGSTALMLASDKGHLEVVKLLTAAGADPNISTHSGLSALWFACTRERLTVIEHLLTLPALLVGMAQNSGITPFHIVCMRGNLAAAKLFLDYLLARSPHPPIALDQPQDDGTSPFGCACASGNTELVALLIGVLTSHGIGLDRPNAKGTTPFMFACIRGHLGVARLLLETGLVDVNAQNLAGYTALHGALRHKHMAVVGLLLAHPALDPNVIPYQPAITPLMQTCYTPDNVASTEMLCRHPRLKVNAKGDKGDTALHVACDKGAFDMVLTLLEAGADPDIRNDRGHTPVWVATEMGAVECLGHMLMARHMRGSPGLGMPDDVQFTTDQQPPGINLMQWAKRMPTRQKDRGRAIYLLNQFARDREGIYGKLLNSPPYKDRHATFLYVMMVLVSDEYMGVASAGAHPKQSRFFKMASRLPQELQMLLAGITYGKARFVIGGRKVHEAASRLLVENWRGRFGRA